MNPYLKLALNSFYVFVVSVVATKIIASATGQISLIDWLAALWPAVVALASYWRGIAEAAPAPWVTPAQAYQVADKLAGARPLQPGSSDAMRSLLALCLSAVLAAGCTTSGGKEVQSALLTETLGPDAINALQELKSVPIFAKLKQDSAATRVWADKFLGPKGTKPDPIKYQLALACPHATDVVVDLIGQTIDDLANQIQVMSAPTDPPIPQGYLMLFLTQLKYGDKQNPQDQLKTLQAKVALQMDALFTGCAHLFPKKQVHDIVKLLGKAGIVGFSGGAAAPFMGLLP